MVAVETNGTIAVPDSVDWICVSPKVGSRMVQTRGDELKFVYPQTDAEPDDYLYPDFRHLWLQPMDGPDRAANTAAAVAYCLARPLWRLSLQTHKMIGIP
jgi:organic radical activating enzyme